MKKKLLGCQKKEKKKKKKGGVKWCVMPLSGLDGGQNNY
jgi:hypothetical protein